MKALGDLINGRFAAPDGEALVSVNPARAGAPVLETAWSAARIDAACDAAAAASAAWARLPIEERWSHLVRFRDQLSARTDHLAEAVVLETGKLRAEARGEVGALVARFDLIRDIVAADLTEGSLSGNPHEQLRYHPLGVVGVIGPFNYPLHLCHAHVVPALLLGNTVVIKPSEVTPLAAQRYAEAAAAAGFPDGVFNLVHGRGPAGAALVAHPAVRGLCFTGSYPVGRAIQEQALDRPELLVALEMGGKNTAVVLDDADVRQAAHEIVVGGYLTTGQRCTCTDRVLVHRRHAAALVDALRPMVASLRFGDPDDAGSFAGPLTTAAGRDRFEAALAAARAAGAEPVVEGGRADGGFFVRASLHRLPDGQHQVAGYTDVETFGPDICVEVIDSDDEALAVLASSPYGLANSIFTGSTERFERFYRESSSGIINRNRSTNLASPRLPFGGVGKSGNYRPAGAFAPRNVVVPMAVQDNVLGTIAVHPMLLDTLPEPNFARLDAQHSAEEDEEARRTLLAHPRPMAMKLPRGGHLPASDSWLIRLYAGERVVREKKPAVFDHLRSAGPWYVSVDDEPLSVLDGMSQTATVCGGFAEDAVVRAYVEGDFDGTVLTSRDTSGGGDPAAEALADTLRHLVPGLPHVTFTNSGAEANEKALALCRLGAADPSARKVLAFEGSFHGRTLLALHATYSPAKREPFEIAGYTLGFAPFPVWGRPHDPEPAAPSGFYAVAAAGDAAQLTERFGDADEDPLLAAEVRSLVAVNEALAGGGYFACIVEPMQSEGGDRYATARFHRALRLLTRYHDMPLVYDEVQCGFGLGGGFAWHQRFQLVNFRGQPDHPDAVTFAKRAQTGVVMSRFEDPEPTSVHPASLVRGRVHAEMMSTSHNAERIEKLVRPRLARLTDAFPHLVSSPRAAGYAFAFDLPDAAHLGAYLGQRFWRGAIVYGAGTRTVRYRLSDAFLAREVELLFDTIRRSLSWLDAHPNARPPEWEDRVRVSAERRESPVHRIYNVGPEEAVARLPAILDIEYRVYEPARRTAPAEIKAALEDPEGIATLCEVFEDDTWRFVGFGIGTPLEHTAEVEGCDRDPMLGRENTLYSVSITVAPEYQGMGLGRAIKEEQLRAAAELRRADGSPRYRYVSGRNRVGHTAQMNHLNRVYGAHTVAILTGQYEDPEGQAIYYRIPLGPIRPDPKTGEGGEGAPLDLAGGICQPLAEVPSSLRDAQHRGLLYGPTVNKITLTNFVTPAVVRALEWIGAMAPELPHMYLASSRDETVDKALRMLRWHRKQASVAIGLAGGYLGHTTAAARSLSDPEVHRQGPAYFDWPRVPHPAEAGTDATIAALRAAIDTAGGVDRCFGLFYEIVQERTGRVLPEDFFAALAGLRADTGLPLIAVETTTGGYRGGVGPFAGSSRSLTPDALIWWAGAQTGFVHCTARFRVPNPLTMVSTWDGDELSLVRQHHQLRTLCKLDLREATTAMDAAMAAAGERGVTGRGLGLYRVLDAGDRGDALVAGLAARGLRARSLPGGRVAVVPPLDRAAEAAERLTRALGEVL
jgi:RHH-type transcriptional regulator, proline utilization regulon repressor / proline dehydrogenase / delta 1-pyrroline-5-carboxylate dehydrogenase